MAEAQLISLEFQKFYLEKAIQDRNTSGADTETIEKFKQQQEAITLLEISLEAEKTKFQ